MKKQFYRVKHLADQKFSRSRRNSEAYSDELQLADRKVEQLRNAITLVNKRLPSVSSVSQTVDTSVSEKRLKKIPEYSLGVSMCEAASIDDDDSILKYILDDCGNIQKCLAQEKAQLEMKIEEQVCAPLNGVCNEDLPAITKSKRQLQKLISDKLFASSKCQQLQRHQQQNAVKLKAARDELEEATAKMDAAHDNLASDMFTLITREAEIAHAFLRYIKLQRAYHEAALMMLEDTVPEIEGFINDNSIKPTFGFSLEDHLKATGRTIAFPIELCVCMLYELARDVEGILRIPGTSSKVKSMKLSFDAGVLTIPLQRQYINIHVISSVFKSYLKELPEPLLTYRLYDTFLTVAKQPTEQDRMNLIWETIHLLPEANFQNLRYVIKFLSEMSKNEVKNKMSASNLAIVVAPNLLWTPNKTMFDMNTTSAILCVVETLIKHADWFYKEDINFFITFTKDELLQDYYEAEAAQQSLFQTAG